MWKQYQAVALFAFLTISETALAAPAASLYDQLHPYYAQICAVTQLKPLDGTNGGGTGGHSVLFLKGVCRDTSYSYPRLKICDEGSIDLSNPEAGTSISVDQMYQNLNWTATDGKSMLITGNIPEGELLDAARQDKLIQQVMDSKIYKGVQLKPESLVDRPAKMGIEEYSVRLMLATEFGLNLGRNVYCARLPITRELLTPMVDELNSLNDQTQAKGEFDWSALHDNCAHTTHNAVAAAGLFEPKKTNVFLLKQIFNLAIPSNEYIDLESLGNDPSLDDVVAYFKDPYKRHMLLEHDWMATQPGVVAENHPIHQPNALYDTHSDFFILDMPLLKPQRKQFNRIVSEPQYTDIKGNLLYFKQKYESALKARLSLNDLRLRGAGTDRDGYPIPMPELSTKEFEQFYDAYYKKIEKELQKVEAQLANLSKS